LERFDKISQYADDGTTMVALGPIMFLKPAGYEDMVEFIRRLVVA
jgi:hypothetical protein